MRPKKIVLLQGNDEIQISVLAVVLDAHRFAIERGIGADADVTVIANRTHTIISDNGKFAIRIPRKAPMAQVLDQIKLRAARKRGPKPARVQVQEAVGA